MLRLNTNAKTKLQRIGSEQRHDAPCPITLVPRSHAWNKLMAKTRSEAHSTGNSEEQTGLIELIVRDW